MRAMVWAFKPDCVETRGVALSGLDAEQIAFILNAFRLKKVRPKKPEFRLQSVVDQPAMRQFDSSFLLRVGAVHTSSREVDGYPANDNDLGADGGEVIAGPNGFCITVPLADEESVKALKMLGSALAAFPLTERKGTRSAEILAQAPRPRKDPIGLKARMWWYRMSAMEGQRKTIAKEYWKTVGLERRRWKKHKAKQQRAKALCLASKAAMRIMAAVTGRNEAQDARPHIEVVEMEMNGQPTLVFMVGDVRDLPQSITKSAARLQQGQGFAPVPLAA